jgi:transcriptional regulator with XRE-family HTH domain
MVLATLDRMTPLEFVRRNAGMSQVEVERVLRLPRGSLSKFERGQHWPWPAARRKLAGFFEVDEAELFGDV